MENSEKKIFELLQGKEKKDYDALKDVLFESFNELEELYNRKEYVTGVPTGFIELD